MPRTTPDGQLYSELASRFFFRPDKSEDRVFPLVEFGDLREASSPSASSDSEDLRLPALCNAVVYTSNSNPSEVWSLKSVNLNMSGWANLLMSEDPTIVNQASAASTAVVHRDVVSGGLMKIVDATGAPVYRLASIDAIGTLVAGTDYEVVDLAIGLVRIIPGGGAGAAGTSADYPVSFTTEEATIQQLQPQTSISRTGQGLLLMQSPCGVHKWSRWGRFIVAPTGTNFSSTSASDADFTATSLSELVDGRQSAGSFSKIAGGVV